MQEKPLRSAIRRFPPDGLTPPDGETQLRIALFAALIACTSVPVCAQAQAADQAPATEMSQAQIAAFNQAVADFTAGQTAQQAGDNATALAKYDAALPAIRTAAQVQPGNLDNAAFLANTLYAAAAANGALQKFDAMLALFEESAPQWRKVSAAKPNDAVSRNILAGIVIQLGNAKLAKQDKAGADPLYAEGVALARKSLAENGADAANRNLLLSGLIGASQTSADAKLKEEAVTMSKAMLADGSIDAANKPSAEILTGTKAAG